MDDEQTARSDGPTLREAMTFLGPALASGWGGLAWGCAAGALIAGTLALLSAPLFTPTTDSGNQLTLMLGPAWVGAGALVVLPIFGAAAGMLAFSVVQLVRKGPVFPSVAMLVACVGLVGTALFAAPAAGVVSVLLLWTAAIALWPAFAAGQSPTTLFWANFAFGFVVLPMLAAAWWMPAIVLSLAGAPQSAATALWLVRGLVE